MYMTVIVDVIPFILVLTHYIFQVSQTLDPGSRKYWIWITQSLLIEVITKFDQGNDRSYKQSTVGILQNNCF